MILLQTAPTINLAEIFNQVVAQYGIIVALLTIGVVLLFLTWRNTVNAKVSQTKVNIAQQEQSIRQDASILDNSIQLTKTLETVAIQGVALAKAEGKVDLLNNQLETERDKRQAEREELKNAIRNLAQKVEGYELKITELEANLNGKALEIKALTLERDELGNQLKDRDAKVLYLEKQVSTLEEEIRGLKAKAEESAAQIETLGQQLANLDPVSSGETGKMQVVIDKTIDKATTIKESQKELSEKSED